MIDVEFNSLGIKLNGIGMTKQNHNMTIKRLNRYIYTLSSEIFLDGEAQKRLTEKMKLIATFDQRYSWKIY